MRLIYAIAALLSWLAAEPAAAQTDDPQQTVRILAHLKLIKSAGIKAPQ